MELKKIVILGAQGMLGQELATLFREDGRYEVSAWDKDDVDIADAAALEQRLTEVRPEIVINAAAYNAVDLCEESEEEYQKAMRLNADVPKMLAEMTARLPAILVHYSTDYVFDGNQGEYVETDMPHPISKYGETKYAGERAVLTSTGLVYLIRLSKLFGKPGKSPSAKHSFFETMLRLGREKPEVRVVDSERSCFTYAPDAARATKALVESGDPTGMYHLPNSGPVTWYEGTLELYRQAGIATPVIPIGSEELKRPARRPASSVLVNTKRPKLRDYQEALTEFLTTVNVC